jgi:hypothetical protein
MESPHKGLVRLTLLAYNSVFAAETNKTEVVYLLFLVNLWSFFVG